MRLFRAKGLFSLPLHGPQVQETIQWFWRHGRGHVFIADELTRPWCFMRNRCLEKSVFALLALPFACTSAPQSSGPESAAPPTALATALPPPAKAPSPAAVPVPQQRWSPLAEAVAADDEPQVAARLDRGDNPNEPEPTSGVTPLQLAAEYGNANLVRLLIERGADVNAVESKVSATALHFAAQNGRAAVVRLLLQNSKVNSSAKLSSGLTPLDLAIGGGDLESVVPFFEFIPAGARPAELADGELFRAVAAGNSAVVKLLLDRGGNVNLRRPEDHGTPLLAAVVGQRFEVAQVLLEHNADVNLAAADGVTPLHAAAITGQAELAHRLLDRHANASALKKGGYRPLHLAAMAGSVGVTTLLLDHDAAIAAETDAGQTAADLAHVYGNQRVEDLLAQRAADRVPSAAPVVP